MTIVEGASAVAAIDCGSNSTRLLVCDGRGEARERLMRVTRLGQGVGSTGRLAPTAIARTMAVLGEYKQVIARHGVGRLRITATSAVRDASNREEFLGVVKEMLDTEPEVLSGEEEGRLSFMGSTSELDPAHGPFLVVDIGGGSTELAVGTTVPEDVCSLDAGCVRITEKFFTEDPPAPEELSDALVEVRDLLTDAVRDRPGLTNGNCMVGLAGTVTTVAAVEIGLATYDRAKIHHFVLHRAAVEEVFRVLATERLADRVHNPGLEEARADVIVGGCAVLVGIMRFFGFDECLVSEADLLDGLVMSLRSPEYRGQ